MRLTKKYAQPAVWGGLTSHSSLGGSTPTTRRLTETLLVESHVMVLAPVDFHCVNHAPQKSPTRNDRNCGCMTEGTYEHTSLRYRASDPRNLL